MGKCINVVRVLIVPFIGCINIGTSLGLSSCSYTPPNFLAAPNGAQDWYDHSFDVISSWIGYYSSDVHAEIKIPSDYSPYINWTSEKSQNHNYLTESLILHFEFASTKNISLQESSIQIEWYVSHTSVHKSTTVKIYKQENNEISWIGCYGINNEPTSIQQPKFIDGNSLTCINGYYNNKPYANGDQTSFSAIQINLTNDILYYQYLLFQELKKIKVSPVLYLSLDPATWRMNVSVSYNLDTQIFNYIQFNITAGATYGGAYVATINVNYAWGNDPTANKEKGGVLEQFDNSNKVSRHPIEIPKCDGPKLLGAYSIFRDPTNIYLQHHPQDNDASFYTQNFLSLVPSDEDPHNCYQFYDFCVFVDNPVFQLFVGKFIGSGYHIYFGRQPRLFGLEQITGSNQLWVFYPPSNQIHADGFANLGLSLPSMSLTNVSYTEKDRNYNLPQQLPEIQQCKSNIDTISPELKNLTYPGNFDEFKNHFFDAYDCINFEYYRHFHVENQEDFSGYGDFIYELKGANESAQTIDPYDASNKQLFDARLDDLQLKNQQILNDTWNKITISDQNSNTLVENVPWWQIIQVRSPRSGELTPNKENCRSFACLVNIDLTNVDPSGKYKGVGSLPSFVYDTQTNQFTRFAIGLNYMFEPSLDQNAIPQTGNPQDQTNIYGDNMFMYLGDQLKDIHYNNG